MRAIWSGSISFGLVDVPVKLYGATSPHDISFHQVHDADGGRIRHEKHCEVCGKKVATEHIDKAYQDGDQTVVLSEDELDALPAESNDEIDVVQFVLGDQIDPTLLGASYYLEPAGKSVKSYALLRTTLSDSELTAVVRFTLRSKTRLGVLRAHGRLLMLQTLLWAEDVREMEVPPALSKARVSDKEKQMASALVEQFSGDFEPERFSDDYQAQLRELIDDKLEQGQALDTDATFGKDGSDDDAPRGGGKVLSLMDALEGSLASRSSGSGTSREKGEGASATSGSGKKAASGKKFGAAKKTGRGTKATTTDKGNKKSEAGKKTAKGTKKTSGSAANSSGGTKDTTARSSRKAS